MFLFGYFLFWSRIYWFGIRNQIRTLTQFVRLFDAEIFCYLAFRSYDMPGEFLRGKVAHPSGGTFRPSLNYLSRPITISVLRVWIGKIRAMKSIQTRILSIWMIEKIKCVLFQSKIERRFQNRGIQPWFTRVADSEQQYLRRAIQKIK
jgi:hypothetical protein